jgi:succinate-semialdehyde dehydrogenase/glutarate-semialdehyde dehydrogenase
MESFYQILKYQHIQLHSRIMRNHFLADKKIKSTAHRSLFVGSFVGVLLELLGTFLLSSSSFAAPNILVGNTILLKHASIMPQCAIEINLFKEAGAPEGLYTNLMISGKVLH